jgi:uncharacterized YigZ family protein
MRDSYFTIRGTGDGLFRDRGSKFLAFAYPVENEEQIKDILAELRKQYHDARHHCYAWRLGPGLEHYRANDDGEPSGSAGLPIYGQIRSRELTDVLVVVVRYFGGTLLGVSGLIRAYREAGAEALDAAGIIERKVCREIRVSFPYEAMNGVMRLCKDFDLNPREQVYDSSCELKLEVWIRDMERVAATLEKIEGCKIVYL